MEKIKLFNNWWENESTKLLAQKELLQASVYFIAQQAFLAGMERSNNPSLKADKLPECQCKDPDYVDGICLCCAMPVNPLAP